MSLEIGDGRFWCRSHILAQIANCKLQISNCKFWRKSHILAQIVNLKFWHKLHIQAQISNSGANCTFECKFNSGANLESQIANCMPRCAVPQNSIQKFSSPGFWRTQFCSATSKSSALYYQLDYSGFWGKLNLKCISR